MFRRIYNPTLFIITIFAVAFFLRVIDLSNVPPSLNWDEVSHGYNAYSILKTGSDEWGKILPLANFRAYGDYPLPLYMYLTMPEIILLGLNEFSIRLTSVIFGSLMVFLVFFLSKELTKKVNVSLLAAFMVAISPWSILASRQVSQATPAVFFLTLGVFLFIRGVENKKLLIFATVSFSLSAYGYHNTRILALPLLLILLFLYRKLFYGRKNLLIGVLLVIASMAIPVALAFLSNEANARAVWVGILDQGAINHIDELRGASKLPGSLTNLFYNRPVYLIEKASQNYLGYFNPAFLGFNGGSQYQFSIPGWGIVYPIELPFFYLGVILLVFNFFKNETLKKFTLLWLLLAPIPAAITKDEYQVVRAMVMMPVFYLAAGMGLNKSAEYFSQFSKKWVNIFMLILILIVGLSFIKFYKYYFNDYRIKYSFAWQYGYKEVANFVKINNDKYQAFYITKKYGEPHEFLLFYLQYDPQKYKTDPNLIRYNRSDWFWVDRFDKYNFLNDWEVIEKTKNVHQAVLITSPGNYPKNGVKIETIKFLNGDPAFDIVELR